MDTERVKEFMTDPLTYFGGSITQMHSVEKHELEALQREAMQLRVAEHLEKIEMVGNLAKRLGITTVTDFNDVVPLFFAHTAYKSYPASLIDKKRWDLLTKWLQKLTTHDLSNVDTSSAQTLDQWLDALDEQTEMEVITSSGTTGTISLIPKSREQAYYTMKIWRCFLFQTFGVEPTEEDMNPDVDVIWPNHARGKLGHLRMAQLIRTEFTGGDESRFHALYDNAIDSDLMFLASKMRAAAAKGELDRLEIDPALMSRKDEFLAMQQRRPQEMAEFFKKCSEDLRGKRVFTTAAYPILYEVSAAGLEQGISGVFADNSAVLTGGGTKGMVLPDNFLDVIREFLGVDVIQEGYGMSEISAFHWACEHGHYHIVPWVIPYVLNPDTSEPLPREGVVTGRAAFYDLINDSHWGGVISGDEVTIHWDGDCTCGRKSVYLSHDIMRYSEKEGIEDDRISCSATQQVADEVVGFMSAFES
ncbi:MAG: hypothetical protein AB8C02_17565 [Halioglobus sp.]